MNQFIPVYRPLLSGNESKYVNACLETEWISSRGEFVSRFEDAFAEYLHAGYACSVCNGTVALHLALYIHGIGKGDEVIVPTLTYIATVNAIAYVGATPVFVDSEPKTWNLDITKIEAKITKKTKAIIAVHLYGAVCDITRLQVLCKNYELFLIEDVAEAFGSKYNGHFAGTFADISTFSFFGNKTITTGEGGMLVSRDRERISRATYMKNQAVSPTIEYWHDEIGFNYRMTNICAAIGLAQLEQAESIIEKKRAIAFWYMQELNSFPLTFQVEPVGTRYTYWMVSILAENQITRDRIRSALKRADVETRPLFYPVHQMPAFHSEEIFPVAEDISVRGINLPSFPTLTQEQVRYICDQIKTEL